jgi:hypothetical protein
MQPADDDREAGLDVAPPLEQAEYGVIVLDELDHNRTMEILRILAAEPGPPAPMVDDLLDELQVPRKSCSGVRPSGGGEGGPGGVLEAVSIAKILWYSREAWPLQGSEEVF